MLTTATESRMLNGAHVFRWEMVGRKTRMETSCRLDDIPKIKLISETRRHVYSYPVSDHADANWLMVPLSFD
jgi:hypothetical protein